MDHNGGTTEREQLVDEKVTGYDRILLVLDWHRKGLTTREEARMEIIDAVADAGFCFHPDH